MRAATQVVNRKPMIMEPIEAAICQAGTPNGIRIIMAIGEVNGMMDNTTASVLSGLLIITVCDSMKVNTSGRVTGSMNCCVSVSLSTAEPTAANKAL